MTHAHPPSRRPWPGVLALVALVSVSTLAVAAEPPCSLAASARSPAHVRLTRCVWRATATLDYSAMAHEAAAAEAVV
ncbi:MAG: hypothetical protein AAFX85_18055, partial [Pseudomonadota bacterium]